MPDFKAENLAKVASGFGGVVYMALALVYLGAMVLLEAYPTYLVYDMSQYQYSPGTRRLLICLLCYAGALALSGAVAWFALESGARSLEERELA